MNKPKPLIKTEAPPSPNKTNDMRYFLISYTYESHYGNFFVESIRMPNQKRLIQHLKEKGHEVTESIVIQNIFEFENKKDFEDFTED